MSAQIPIVIKWQGRKYDVEVDTSEPGATLKLQLYSLTSVPPEKQKILVRGGQLRDDQDMSALNLKPNQAIMMMGTVGELKGAEAAVSATKDAGAHDSASEPEPAGLLNLGNTCYMNSTLQVLGAVPDLQDALASFKPGNIRRDVASSLHNLYKHLKTSPTAYSPILFLATLREAYPQFAERSRDHKGEYAQQDAEECWSAIISSLQTTLRTPQGESWVEKYMTGTTRSIMKAEEAGDEEPIESGDQFTKLSCHISAKTNFMMTGIQEGLHEEITKSSPSLGRDAVYEKDSTITRLPKYLAVSFVRFYWKASIRKKAKILRKVKFPFEFDAVELCAPELKEKLVPVRDRLREIGKVREEKERVRKRAKMQLDAADKATEATEVPEEQQEYDAAVAELTKTMDPELLADDGANASGIYDLVGVLTHKGPSADAGHYQAWVRKGPKSDNNAWYRFDDDKVTVVDQARIEQLDGGGESDTAYILLYGAREFPRP